MTVNQKKGRQAEAALLPTEFSYSDNNKLQAIIIDGQPYVIAKDICVILGYKNITSTLKSLDEDEKLTYEIYRSGQKRKVNLINESGLYNLIFRSNKPEAKAFKKWVTNEVLPTLRKTGSYTPHQEALLLQIGKDVNGVFPLFQNGKIGYPRKDLLICCERSHRNGYRLAKRYPEDCFYIGQTACVSLKLAELLAAQYQVRQLELNFGDMKSGGVQ